MTKLLIISLCSLRLTGTVFSQLLEKVIFMTLCTKEKTCDKAGFKSRFFQVHQAGKIKIGVNRRNLCHRYLCPRYPRLINALRSTKVYVRNYKLFLQNEPNFQKVKLNVTNVLTKNYDQLDTWSIRKNEPKRTQS